MNALLLASAFAAIINQAPPNTLQALQSTTWQERDKAVTRLISMPASERAAVLADEENQQALLGLLQRENAEIHRLYRDGSGAPAVYGEGYSEYYADLLGVALEALGHVDRGTLQASLVSTIADGAYNPTSDVVAILGAYGDLSIDAAINLISSATEPGRWNGYELLGATLGRAERALPMSVPLSAAARIEALDLLEKGLRSADIPTARHAIHALGETRTGEALRLLQQALPLSDPTAASEKHAWAPTSRSLEMTKAIDVIRVWRDAKR